MCTKKSWMPRYVQTEQSVTLTTILFVPHKMQPVISGQVTQMCTRNNSLLPKCVQKIIRCLDVYKRNSWLLSRVKIPFLNHTHTHLRSMGFFNTYIFEIMQLKIKLHIFILQFFPQVLIYQLSGIYHPSWFPLASLDVIF